MPVDKASHKSPVSFCAILGLFTTETLTYSEHILTGNGSEFITISRLLPFAHPNQNELFFILYPVKDIPVGDRIKCKLFISGIKSEKQACTCRNQILPLQSCIAC
jgi:hypothetical protein